MPELKLMWNMTIDLKKKGEKWTGPAKVDFSDKQIEQILEMNQDHKIDWGNSEIDNPRDSGQNSAKKTTGPAPKTNDEYKEFIKANLDEADLEATLKDLEVESLDSLKQAQLKEIYKAIKDSE